MSDLTHFGAPKWKRQVQLGAPAKARVLSVCLNLKPSSLGSVGERTCAASRGPRDTRRQRRMVLASGGSGRSVMLLATELA